MLTRLATLGIRAPRRVLGLAGLLLAVTAVLGAPVVSHLSSGGFNDPNSQSQQANALLAQRFGVGDTNLVLTVRAPGGAASPAARRAGTHLVTELRRAPHVSEVQSYWTVPAAQAAGLRSHDGTVGLVVGRVAGNDDAAPTRAGAIVPRSSAGTTAPPSPPEDRPSPTSRSTRRRSPTWPSRRRSRFRSPRSC